MNKIKCIKFPKIEQFRNIISNINRMSNYVGSDEQGNPIYDHSLSKPLISWVGTIKIHGSNAGISYNKKFGIWTQSRNNAFDLNSDTHMGFTQFVRERKNVFMELIDKIIDENSIDTDKFVITIFGEWAGEGIQKKVAISEIDKSFFIFGIKVSNPDDEDFKSYWLDYSNIHLKDIPNEHRIYNILDFEKYEITIDFNYPGLVQEKIANLVNKVENECPVGKQFGISGIGEGIVWTGSYKGNTYRFKTKGQKHSVSKTKTFIPIDVEKLESIQEFVDYSVTKVRFEQALSEIFETEEDYDMKKTGDLLRWIVNDIMSEESDVLEKNGLTPKDVNKYISTKAREMFFNRLKF